MTTYSRLAPTLPWKARGRSTLGEVVPEPDEGSNWSDTNLPWAYSSSTEWTSRQPAGATVVNIQTGSADFYTNLKNTCDAASGRVIVRLSAGTYHLNQFRMIGSSGSVTYAFGFWHTKLQGLVGAGPDQTFVQMDANSMSAAQLTAQQTMDPALFAPNQLGFMRLDGTAASPVYLGGITFQGADQQNMTATLSPAVVPQPAPYNGITIYNTAHWVVSHCRFQAAAHAATSSPPFEHANLGTQRGTGTCYNSEFDGRLAASINPARPRRCGVVMVNNETYSAFVDSYFHHSNVSRYAANDENSATTGQYILTRCKLEQITNTRNTDPALNGGNTLSGWTNATPTGWESVNGTITLNNCIISQDNPYLTAQSGNSNFALHMQLTSTGSRNPQGGRLTINGGDYRCTVWPQLDRYVMFRIAKTTYWWLDGPATTLKVYHRDGQLLAPYSYTGTWPPTATQLTSAGVSESTHYIVRGV